MFSGENFAFLMFSVLVTVVNLFVFIRYVLLKKALLNLKNEMDEHYKAHGANADMYSLFNRRIKRFFRLFGFW